MPVNPGAATTWLRASTAVVASVVGGLMAPIAVVAHVFDASHATGDAGLVVLGLAGLAVVVTLPLTVTTVLVLVRALPRCGTVALLAGSLVLPACLTMPLLLWPLPVAAAAAAAWWASGHLPVLSRLLRTHGEATASRAARATARATDAGRAR